jgi:Predicted S-adenosylmethionine-dependent methyltransferase involved in cell envelope biogenesis
MRHLDGLIPLSRRALASALSDAPGGIALNAPGGIAVDATAGNGHDTLFLAANVGAGGRVWAFDVQEAAIVSAKSRLQTEAPHLLDTVTFIHAGHETASTALPPEARGNIRAVTFNLGYLPGSDKHIVTTAPATLAALESLSAMLAVGGVLCVHSYQGHTGGEEEGKAVAGWFAALPWEAWRVAEYGFCNKHKNPEVLFLAERVA